jgi:hypothetical protein
MRLRRFAIGGVMLLGLVAGVIGASGASGSRGGQVVHAAGDLTFILNVKPKDPLTDQTITGSGTVTIPGGLPDKSGDAIIANGRTLTRHGTGQGTLHIQDPAKGQELTLAVRGPATYVARFATPVPGPKDTPFDREILGLSAVVTKSNSSNCSALPGGKQRTATITIVNARGYVAVRVTLQSCPGQPFLYTNPSDPGDCISGYGRFLQSANCRAPAAKPTEPTTLTLTVNGKSATATTAKPTNDDPNPLVVPYGTSLNIKVSANAPMPPGWDIKVHHNGDVLSTGSGDYPTVCEVKSRASSCSVTRPPPTAALTGDVDDALYAQLETPTGNLRYVQILVYYRK